MLNIISTKVFFKKCFSNKLEVDIAEILSTNLSFRNCTRVIIVASDLLFEIWLPNVISVYNNKEVIIYILRLLNKFL